MSGDNGLDLGPALVQVNPQTEALLWQEQSLEDVAVVVEGVREGDAAPEQWQRCHYLLSRQSRQVALPLGGISSLAISNR